MSVTVVDIPFIPYKGCPLAEITLREGFGVSVSGMNITVASGHIEGFDAYGSAFSGDVPSASATVTAPTGDEERCFGFWSGTDWSLYFDDDTSTMPNLGEYVYPVTKAVWGYCSSGDVTLDGKELFMNI